MKEYLLKIISSVLFVALATFVIAAQPQPVCDDEDYDYITDEEDNCQTIFNPAQEDEDSDGIGNPCDDATPLHEGKFARCYRTNYAGFTGPGWEDIQTTFYDPDQRHFSGMLRWPDAVHDTLEKGPGHQNGESIWFMGQYLGVELFTATYIEAKADELNENNVVQHFTGMYHFLKCEGQQCEFNLVWESWWYDVIEGDIMPPEFCGLEADDDTAADDDTTDDDVSPDDDTADDDTADDDAADDDAADDDAADDDAADDDAAGDDDDDDDDSGGCGC